MLPIMIVAGILSVGTAFADTFSDLIINGPTTLNGVTTVNGVFRINDNVLQFVRTDNVQTALVVSNSDKQSGFTFLDPDDDQRYILRNTPGPGGKFELLDNSGVSPTARIDISIKRSTGNVGIGTNAPTEILDVNGNLRVRGNIVSTDDICIGNCS